MPSKRREDREKKLTKKRARQATDPELRSTRMRSRRAVIGDRETWRRRR